MFFLARAEFRKLSEKVADLESAMRRLEDDWEEMAAKLRRRSQVAAREAGRLERAQQAKEEADANPVPSGPPLDPISQRILSRRAKMFARPNGGDE